MTMTLNEQLLREAAEAAGVDVETARKWLAKAIKLHELHMAGKAPTTGKDGEKSQQQMMDQMLKALAALGGKQGMDKMREAQATEFAAIGALVTRAVAAVLYPGRPDAWVSLEALYLERAVVRGNDGRLYAYPYTLNDANQVELGAPAEVVLEHKPVATMREAQGLFLEAQDEKGLRWMIRVIRAGLSGNRNYYSDAVLREATPLFDRARVFAKADDEHLEGKGKSVRNVIGRLSAPKFVEGKTTDTGEIRAVLDLLESAGEIPAKLLEAWKRDMASDLFGFSIDATGKAKLQDGKRVAQKITKVNSVDLIIEPGAGGQLINLLEAQNPDLENDTMKQRMLEAIKKANSGKLPDGLDVDNEEQVEAAYREAIAKPAPAPEKKDTTQAVTLDDLRMVEARAHLRAAVAESDLPDVAKEKIKSAFAGRERFSEADVDNAIKAEREYLARFVESGKVQGLGDSIRIEAGKDRSEKVREMLDAFFDPKHKEHGKVQSFKECYVDITGDRRVTGSLRDCDQARLRESLGVVSLRESLDSTSFANVLGDSITRRLVADYRTPNQYDVWRPISNVVPVNDFRTQERVRYGGYGDLPAVGQGAAYAALASPDDEKATYAISKRGGTEDLTVEMIRNDDVGAIRQIPVKLSRAAKRTLAKFVLDFIRTNPVLYDGVAWFHATHGNLGAAALAAASLAAGRLAMLKQTERDSNDRLGIPPKFLLVAPDNEEAAFDLFRRQTNNDTDFVEALQMTVLPVWYWTDANDWALLTDPMDIPTIEVGFLDGNQEPELFVQDLPNVGSMFSNDKLTYKIRHIYGGAVTDYRGGYKAVVA